MNQPFPPSPLHSLLRQATKHAHHALDHHPILAPLIKPGLDASQYGNALASLHGIYKQLETWILDFLAQHQYQFNYRDRLKLPALEADLAALGRTPLPICQSLPIAQDIGGLIGILYTVEGSTQGGQVIARVIRQNTVEDLPLSFFSGYGTQSRQRWEEFLLFADLVCPKSEYETAQAAAVSTFEAIKNHLDATLHQLGQASPSGLHTLPA